MILKLAVRSLAAHPVRSLVLACGFGLGVGVMATLLGVGEVILDQARSPDLVGGGDLVITSATGKLSSSRWILSSALRVRALDRRLAVASPASRARLFLVGEDGVLPIRARGGIPSLERGVGDPETVQIPAWIDAASDGAWTSPDPAAALAALDRFHPIPDVPRRADSWAEWLYFNGRAGENRFYLTFLVGPKRADGKRAAGVRLQLDRGGRLSSYSDTQDVAEAEILSSAPNLAIGRSRVRLDGMRYQITLDLGGEPAQRASRPQGGDRLVGSLAIDAAVGRALPPLTIRGAGGWLSGYVVPVMSGALSGELSVEGQRIAFDGGLGYHDHNWGFWDGVSWQWGQVQQGDLSFVYGRVRPPADAADPDRIPGFMVALGPDGPHGYSTDVTIEETGGDPAAHPQRIVVRGRGSALDLTMDIAVEDAVATRMGGGLFGGGLDFLQLRGIYHVSGRAGDRSIDFKAPGAAETFRSR